MKSKLLNSYILLLALAACQQMASTARAAVAFNVTPSAVSNFYAGPITLQIGGLNPGETVQLDKFLDANGNGVIDAADMPVQSFRLTDGQASVCYSGATAVTNINVPGDFNPPNGAITAQLRIASDVAHQIVAQYIFRLSSPTSRFTPLTNLFNVTNSAYNKFFTGAVQSGGTNVPNAVVMVVPGDGRHGGPFAGVMANNTGNYTLNLPGGTYSFWLVKSNFVADLSKSPTLTLTNGATFTTNLSFLVPATTSVSGRVVDAANTNTGLPDVFMLCQSPDGQYLAGACYTGANGAFTVPVIPGQWEVMMDSEGLAAYGYLGLNDHPQVDTTTGSVSSVTLALPKATALFYGSVFDNQSHPLAGIYVLCQDNNDQYVMDYRTDANGYFVAPAVGGLSNNLWRLEVDSDTAPTNYLFTRPAFNQNGGTNLNAGQALPVNFTAVFATNHISGWLKDNSGNPIIGVGILANTTINSVDYYQHADTDINGNYSMYVANGTWSVSVNNGGAGDTLPGNYVCPPNQTLVISNNNGTANFVALPANNHISGWLKDNSGNPIIGVGILANTTINSVDYYQHADTDINGNYSMYVANGTWSVSVNNGEAGDALPGNYVCPPNQTLVIANNNGTANFTAQPLVPLQVTTLSLPGGPVGVYYDQSLGASGGQPPYTWWLPGGTMSLPPGQSGGMSFSSDGNISGTPSTAGTYTFWVGVYDSASPQNIVTQQVSLTINERGADVFDYYVAKMEYFTQLDHANTVLNTSIGPFLAYLGLVQSAPGLVPLANVTLPGGSQRPLPAGSSGIKLQTQERFSDQASIDATYPPGNYTFGLYAVNDGAKFPVLSMPPAAYPIPPHVSNFAAAQSINPLASFTLQWDPMPGAHTNDNFWVLITEAGGVVFSTPDPATDHAAALQGTATSVIVPANTFQPGHAYTGWITYSRATSLNLSAYPGAAGVTTMGATTSFPLTPSSGALRLDQVAKLSGTQYRFQLSGTTGQTYSIQVSTNLVSTNWFTLMTTNLSASPALIQDNQATNKQRFYRVKVGL